MTFPLNCIQMLLGFSGEEKKNSNIDFTQSYHYDLICSTASSDANDAIK